MCDLELEAQERGAMYEYMQTDSKGCGGRVGTKWICNHLGTTLFELSSLGLPDRSAECAVASEAN